MDETDPNLNAKPLKKDAVSLVKVYPEAILAAGVVTTALTVADRSLPSSYAPFPPDVMAGVAIAILTTSLYLSAMRRATRRKFYALTPEMAMTLEAALEANPAPETPDRSEKPHPRYERTAGWTGSA
ncbi:MAG TPA: hypothetical protein VGZ00_01020 [Candidatus Baltobacteraceae bacterium]|nr:hypothetical protein [Candidatus Baltobacteraceae bacterium]